MKLRTRKKYLKMLNEIRKHQMYFRKRQMKIESVK